MTLFGDLLQVYDSNEEQVGQTVVLGNRRAKLFPLGTGTQQAQIQVVIDQEGGFKRAEVIPKEDAPTIVPMTIESANRVSTQSAPHPIHDKLKYVAGDYLEYGGKKSKIDYHQDYMNALEAWVSSEYAHPRVAMVYEYLKKGALIHDLVRSGVLVVNDQMQMVKTWPKEDKENKPAILSVVTGNDQLSSFVRFDTIALTPLWEDETVFESFFKFFMATFSNASGLDYVTGENTILTEKNPRFIRYSSDGAKLISGNDSSGFTFRGRFSDKKEVAQIGYVTSQKAHNALTWLITLQGSQIDGRVYLTWLDRKLSPTLDITGGSSNFLAINEGSDELPLESNVMFGQELGKAIHGYKTKLSRSNQIKQAHVLQLDAAVPGRLAVLDYQTIDLERFFGNLEYWYQSASWHAFAKINNKTKLSFGAPSLKRIARAALGENASDALIKNIVSTLVPCVVNQRPIPYSVVQSINNRVCRLNSFDSMFMWQDTLNVACAVNRKFYEKEEYTVSLDKNSDNRSYLFGRLLGVMDVVESRALWAKSNNQGGGSSTRATNALRYMQTFSVRPESTMKTIHEALVPYLETLNNRGFYQKEIGQIMDQFKGDDYNDRPLNGTYLLGFYSQRQELNQKKQQDAEVAKND